MDRKVNSEKAENNNKKWKIKHEKTEYGKLRTEKRLRGSNRDELALGKGILTELDRGARYYDNVKTSREE